PLRKPSDAPRSCDSAGWRRRARQRRADRGRHQELLELAHRAHALQRGEHPGRGRDPLLPQVLLAGVGGHGVLRAVDRLLRVRVPGPELQRDHHEAGQRADRDPVRDGDLLLMAL
ncbi:MAG: hypothetical protein ACK55I_35880, partial [bacterium]